MKLNLKNLIADKFIRGTFILTAVTFLSSVLNYFVHPFLTRHLSIAQYGDYQALLSFTAIFGVVGAVIITTLTREFSVLSASHPEEINSLRRRAANRFLYLGLAMFAVVWLLSGWLEKIFQISDRATLLLAALSLIFAFPLLVNRALLTGRQYFSGLSLNNFLDAASRLLLIIIFVIFWPRGLAGAALGLGLGGLFAFVLSFRQIKKIGLPTESRLFTGSLKNLVGYALLVLWFTAISQFFYNFDLLFVKSIFSPEEAGLYGALLTIGRIIYFVGGAIPLVMFPVIANLSGVDAPRRFRILGKSLGLMAAIAVPAWLVIALWPELVIRIIVGVKYLSIAPYLPAMALVFGFFTLLTVLSQYFLALGRRRSLIILSLVAGLEAVLLNLFHHDLWSVIYSLVTVFAAGSLALGILVFWEYRGDRLKQYEE